uniref:Uncharacterized protein n=1 Tax=Anguilla anguilla TaxID=7936 RepID=A0A0E9XU84_ANGAN
MPLSPNEPLTLVFDFVPGEERVCFFLNSVQPRFGGVYISKGSIMALRVELK